MRHVVRFLGIAASSASVLLAGCGGSRDAVDEGASASAIVHGALDERDVSVAALIADGHPGWVCTATVIGRRSLLTAAHCLEGGNSNKSGWKFRVAFATDKDHPTASDVTVDVASYVIPDRYRQIVLGQPMPGGPSPGAAASGDPVASDNDQDADIAILTLVADAPVSPVPLADDGETEIVGAGVRLVGYGQDLPNAGQLGIRREAQTTISRIAPGSLEIPGSVMHPCHGDSGGPMFASIGGAERLVGVARDVFDGTCQTGASYTRVDLYRRFILDARGEP